MQSAGTASVEDVIDTFRVDSRASFMLLGKRYSMAEERTPASPDSALGEEARSLLESLLYAILHCRQASRAAVFERPGDWVRAREFVRRVSAANAGTGAWESGWTVRSSEPDGTFLVEKDGLRLWASAAEFRVDVHQATAGTRGFVKLPKEYRELFPGQYMALSNRELSFGRDIVRLYWHIKAQAAEPLTSEVTTRLNRSGTPFRLKLLGDPVDYRRADAAVLYVPRRSCDVAAESIRVVYGQLRRQMRSSCSAFAKRLAPGLSLAEEPGNGKSFGEHRSELLAAALTTPHAAAASSTTDRRAAVTASLGQSGYDAGALYLNPGSADLYEPLTQALANAH